MYNICVFGGTTEGRELVEFLSAQPCNVTACVVTDYAQSLLPASGHVTVSAKKLPAGEIAAMLLSQRFDLVVDATHPYAQSITKSIARACRETGTQYVRLLRKPSAVSSDALYFETTEEAISFLRRTSGRILLTTGSKELSQYAAIEDFSNRVWARVLPLASSLDACQKAEKENAGVFDEVQSAILREAAEEQERLSCIPPEEYRAYAELTARATGIWTRAREKNDFASFAPVLKEIISYQKKFAAYRAKP